MRQRDRGQAVAAAAQQDLAAMVEKGLQRLLQAHHPWHAGGIEDIEVERHSDFELGQAEQLLHQHLRLDVARLRFEHESDILGQLVTNIGEQRQFLFFEQGRDFLDQPPFRHLIRHFSHDDLVRAVP